MRLISDLHSGAEDGPAKDAQGRKFYLAQQPRMLELLENIQRATNLCEDFSLYGESGVAPKHATGSQAQKDSRHNFPFAGPWTSGKHQLADCAASVSAAVNNLARYKTYDPQHMYHFCLRPPPPLVADLPNNGNSVCLCCGEFCC